MTEKGRDMDKIVFKRGVVSFLMSFLGAFAAGFVVWLILSWFVENEYVLYGVPVAITAILVYMAIFSENIKFEIENDIFRYYKRGKLKHELNLKEYSSGYRSKSSDGTADDISLIFVSENGDEIRIDATPLGNGKFFKMYEVIEGQTKKETAKLKTIKKGEKK